MEADSREQISRLKRLRPKHPRSLLVRYGRVVAVSITLALVAAALGTWATSGLSASEGAGNHSITEDPVSKLSVGDCVRDMSSELLEVVHCSKPHTDEVYGKFTLPVEDYPGEKRAEFLAWTGCDSLFEEYTGLTPGRYKFEEYINYPTAGTWGDDRSVVCTVAASRIPSTGSLRKYDG